MRAVLNNRFPAAKRTTPGFKKDRRGRRRQPPKDEPGGLRWLPGISALRRRRHVASVRLPSARRLFRFWLGDDRLFGFATGNLQEIGDRIELGFFGELQQSGGFRRDELAGVGLTETHWTTDRKSTRLNSSHR